MSGDGQPITSNQRMLYHLLGEYAPSRARLDEFALDRHVSAATPPAFLWHTADDPVVPAMNALRFAAACAQQPVPFELHMYASGPHGLALGDAAATPVISSIALFRDEYLAHVPDGCPFDHSRSTLFARTGEVAR